MAAFKRPRNLNDTVIKTRLDNPLPNGGFKTSLDPRCLLHKHNTNTDGFKSPITGRTHKIFGNTSFRTDNVIYFISCKFALSNTLVKQMTSAEESTTTALHVRSTRRGISI